MRRRGLLASALLILSAAISTILALGAGPAQATSCVGWPDDVSDQIVRGRLPALGGADGTESFTQRYDYAVIGTVTAVRGDGQNGTPVEAMVEVRAALFQPAGPTLTLQMSDAGAMLGVPFETGHTYLIPVKSSGPNGLRNYVMICDPVREVPGSEVAGLLGTARSAGVPVVEAVQTSPADGAGSTSGPGGTGGTAGSGGPGGAAGAAGSGGPGGALAAPPQAPGSDRAWWLGLGAIVLLGVTAGAVVLRRRQAIE